MSWDEAYWKDVQATVDRLRTACLGQDVPLSQTLPQHIKRLPVPEQADYLTDLLLFSLARRVEEMDHGHLRWAEQALRDSRDWLYGSILFLFTQCNGEDQTFGNILRVIQLEQDTRAVMFADRGDAYKTICHQLQRPALLEGEGLELAILRLAEKRGRLIRGRKIYRRLQMTAHH